MGGSSSVAKRSSGLVVYSIGQTVSWADLVGIRTIDRCSLCFSTDWVRYRIVATYLRQSERFIIIITPEPLTTRHVYYRSTTDKYTSSRCRYSGLIKQIARVPAGQPDRVGW
jgi:hypothetical protein